jgi:predicted histidine transporter YuiF (NhaC family)
MSFTTDPNQLIIAALIFVLGLLIGIFLTAGGRRKWRTRYDAEVQRRRDLEKTHEDREKHWAEREKDWRERDSLRGAAARSSRDPADDRPL